MVCWVAQERRGPPERSSFHGVLGKEGFIVLRPNCQAKRERGILMS